MAPVRVATFNLLHGRSLVDGATRAADLKSAAAALDADVLGVQEVDRGQPRSGSVDQAAVVADALDAPWWRFVPTVSGAPGAVWTPAVPGQGFARPGDPGREPGVDGPAYGLALVSRLEALSWHVLRFPAAPVGMPLLVPGRGITGVDDEPRAVLAAVVVGPAGPCTVATAHLSFVPGYNVAQLRNAVRWLRRLPGPHLLLGDLNLPGRVPARLTGWTQLARVATYPSWRPRVQWDHALARGVSAGQVTAVDAPRLAVSDHCALAVTLDL